MMLVEVIYCMRGVLKIFCRLPAIFASSVAFPSHKEFEGFTKHACITHMVYLIFLFTFNLHWLRRWWEKPIDFVASIRRKMVDVENIMQFQDRRELKSIIYLRDNLCHLERTQLLQAEFLRRDVDFYLFGL